MAEFNKLTGGECAGDGGIDVAKLRAWQRGRGLEADGRIGSKTLQAARNEKKNLTPEEKPKGEPGDLFEGEVRFRRGA